MAKSTLKCKGATLTPDGGINTVWEDTKDATKKYEICFSPETAEAYIDYSNWIEKCREAESEEK